jgi:hypothetical protein
MANPARKFASVQELWNLLSTLANEYGLEDYAVEIETDDSIIDIEEHHIKRFLIDKGKEVVRLGAE